MKSRSSRSARSAPTSSARTAALALLTRRDYTRRELRDKLTDRGYADEDVMTTIADLEHAGLVDDVRVAAAHVRTSAGVKGRGRRRIEQELAARGIPRDVARTALAAIEDTDERAAIARILSRKRLSGPLDPASRRRIVQHLLRRGFSGDAIHAALRGPVEDT
jgi:regulatory protein